MSDALWFGLLTVVFAWGSYWRVQHYIAVEEAAKLMADFEELHRRELANCQ